MNTKLPIAVHIFLIKKGKVLLIKRRGTGFKDGFWSIPAGRLQKSETITQAVKREAREEVGVIIDNLNIGAPLVMHHHDSRGERLYFFFLCKKSCLKSINRQAKKS